MTTRERVAGCIILYIQGEALLFHSFLQTIKVVDELLEFKYKY